MVEPHWTSYVGMITGIVGMITGIVGSLLGIVSYRRSTQIKALDLRIELKRKIVDINTEYNELIAFLPKIDERKKRSAAISGTMVKWQSSFIADTEFLKNFAKELPAEKNDLDKLSPNELECELIHIYKIQKKISEYFNKYRDVANNIREQVKLLNESIICDSK